MNPEIRKRILLDLLVTPTTCCTAVGGMTLIALSAFFGSFVGFLGVCGVGTSVGLMITNYLCRFETVANNVLQKIKEEEINKKKELLNKLDRKLVRDKDPRDQEALRELRKIYYDFFDDLEKGQLLSVVPDEMKNQINDIFDAIVAQLEKQYKIWDNANKVSGKTKKKLLKQREEMIEEIQVGVENLSHVIEEIRTMDIDMDRKELKNLQSKLDSQLNVAKTVNTRINEFEDDLDKFSEYH